MNDNDKLIIFIVIMAVIISFGPCYGIFLVLIGWAIWEFTNPNDENDEED